MMIKQINILFFLGSSSLVDELINKLKRSGVETNPIELNNKRLFSAPFFQMKNCVNVLIVRQEDMLTLKNATWNTIPTVDTIRQQYKSLNVVFCIDCDDIIPQLSDYFNIKKTIDSAEIIRREILLCYNRFFQTIKGRYGFFVGRNKEIEQFQNLYFSEKSSRTNAMVVSGRPGVGREAYVRECIKQSYGTDDDEPFILSMGKNGSIELFLVQLNSVLRSFSEDSFLGLLKKGRDEKVECAVSMLNDLLSNNSYLILYDDGGACIQYDRRLSDWFKSVFSHPKLKGGMHIYVISNIAVSYSQIRIDEGIAFITLYGLTMSDRKKILYKQMSEQSVAIPEEDVHFLAEKLAYSPNQLMRVVEDIKNKPINIKDLKNNIGNYLMVGDKKILPLIKSYDTEDHPEAKNILVLLSRIEYVSNKILKAVFPNEIFEVEKEIDRFMADGIVERFGEMMGLIRLDGAIGDFIRRNKVDYEKYIQVDIPNRLSKIIYDSPKITEDYSAYLEKLKIGVKNGRYEDESFLVPSVLVNTITELYDGKDWPGVVDLCEIVLEKHPDYFDEVYKEITYWYCLALARIQDKDKFYNNVNRFFGADLHFLKGFYLRIGKQYAKAEDEYRKALNTNPNFSRAKREMVLVLQAQHKFESALQMAEQNYEKDPENAYHIHAYFRCLVRKRDITQVERSLLVKFKEDANGFFKTKYFIDGMNFEYMRFIDHAKPKVLFQKAQELMQKYKDKPYIQDIVDEFYVFQGVKPFIEPNDFSDEFNF